MAASPNERADHWHRFRRLLAVAAVVAAVTVAAALTGLAAQGVTLRLPLVLAVAAGITGSIMLAAALMGLVFVSARSGHDDAVKALNEQGRPTGRPWQ
jgi:choline-glycine betaine transporter